MTSQCSSWFSHLWFKQIYFGKRRPKQCGRVERQCTRYKQQFSNRAVNRSGSTLSYLKQQELVLAQAMLCLVIRTSYENLMPGHRRECQQITKEGPWRGPYKIIMQRLSYEDPGRTFLKAPAQSIVKILMQGPPQGPVQDQAARISTRSGHKDLCKIVQGPPEEGFE